MAVVKNTNDNSTITIEDNSDDEDDILESFDDDVPDVSKVKFTRKETFYFKQIDRFFRKLDKDQIDKMINIINGDSRISLRSLDWFVTIYAADHKITYKIKGDEDEDDEEFNVYIGYKAQLKSFKKRYFDPFRRRQKFLYKIYKKDDNGKIIYKKELPTTIGQLNFFKWAFTNNLVSHVEKNHSFITEKMGKATKEKKKNSMSSKKEESIKKEKDGVKVKAKKKIDGDKARIIVEFE